MAKLGHRGLWGMGNNAHESYKNEPINLTWLALEGYTALTPGVLRPEKGLDLLILRGSVCIGF